MQVVNGAQFVGDTLARKSITCAHALRHMARRIPDNNERTAYPKSDYLAPVLAALPQAGKGEIRDRWSPAAHRQPIRPQWQPYSNRLGIEWHNHLGTVRCLPGSRYLLAMTSRPVRLLQTYSRCLHDLLKTLRNSFMVSRAHNSGELNIRARQVCG